MWGADATALVVDDDEGCRELHSHWLGDSFTVRTAGDGRAALDAVDGSVDLIVLDREMPGLTGVEVLERLDGQGFDGHVVMVTGVEPDFGLVDLPVDDYLVKPISESDLRSTVERLRRRAGYHVHLRELFTLSTKKARLEVEKPREELLASEEYDELVRAIEQRRERVRSALEDDSADWLAAFEACVETPPAVAADPN